MTSLAYEIVDVFTDRPYAGNPLAVVLDADGLDTAQMHALAGEFNLSETAFVLQSDAGADYRVRIFTATRELPFAGHPSVGTAVTLARLGRISGRRVIQQCGAGLLPVELTEDTATLAGGEPTVSDPLDPARLLAAVGLTAADLSGPAARHAGAGLDHTYLPVSDAAVTRAAVDPVAFTASGLDHLTVFSWVAESRRTHLRMFGQGLGVPEDPATGSSALGLGVWLVAEGLVPGEGRTSYTIAQGSEMGRPSRLDCTVEAAGGRAVRTTVTGRVVSVARGEIVAP